MAIVEIKDTYFQKLRALAIIAIVIIHTISGDKDSIIIFREFINFPVAMFFFISGYFIRMHSFQKEESSKRFILKRLKRILIPYIIWSLISLIFVQKFYHFNIKLVMINLITGQIVNIYYFIIVLTQLIIITPLLISTLNHKTIKYYLLLLTPISLLALYILELGFGIIIISPYYALPFTIWFFFYYYGIIVGNNQGIEQKIVQSFSIYLILYVICILLSIIEGYVILNKYGLYDFAISQIKMSSFLASLFLINVFIGIKRYYKPNKLKMLSIIGDYSFGIYLIHIFIIQAINKIAILFKLPSFHWLLITLITIMLSCLYMRLTIKLIGKKNSKNLLGF
jgi:peptidoglycan/LPS O-acetylase OafA/YrhL